MIRFIVIESPIWMDSSTSAECISLEESIGGPSKLAEITGSKYVHNEIRNYEIEHILDSQAIKLLEYINYILSLIMRLNEFL